MPYPIAAVRGGHTPSLPPGGGGGGGGGGLPATDAFTGADHAPLSANWTTLKGSWEINTGAARPLNSGDVSLAYWNADVFADDQYAEGTLSPVSGSCSLGPSVRVQPGSASGYTVLSYNGATGLWRVDAGTLVSLAGGAAGATNDRLRIEATGSLLTVYKGGVSIITASDSTYASGSAGMGGFDTAVVGLDDWEGGNL